jgi:hypothetical protein
MRPALIAASSENTAFVRHYDNMYVSTQASAIRRLADGAKGTASFEKLLGSIERNSKILSAELRESMSSRDDEQYWRERDAIQFKERWCKADTDHIDKGGVRGDREEFARLASNVKEFADNAVAHRHDGVFESEMTYGDLDAAIDYAGLLLRRYEEVLNASHLALLEPAIQGDWRLPFRQVLMPPEARDEHGPNVLNPAPTWKEERS